MKTYDIRALKDIRLSGRFDPAQPGFPLLWSNACADLRVKATRLDVRIECGYRTLRPYLSFTVNGLRAQFLSPLPGTHWYTVFLGMEAQTVHAVRIALETQAFSADPASFVALHALRTDGEFAPLPEPRLRIEAIGDSITSGEGLRGPKPFMEWLPMVFCASDTYERQLAELLHAQLHTVSQSGWGLITAWDNNPQNNLPDVYDQICGPIAFEGANRGGEKPYAFDYDPDVIVVNLGTNDSGAMQNAAFIDPRTGAVTKQQADEAGLHAIEERAFSFLLHLAEKNPHARIYWAFGAYDTPLVASIQSAVQRARTSGVPARYISLRETHAIRGGVGSREHPGYGSHREMARRLAKAIREDNP